MSTWTAGSFCLHCFWQAVKCLWSLNMSGIHCHMTSSPTETSIRPGGSFGLCYFWQALGRLWSLPVSGIPNHTDLHLSRNVNPKSWFIQSVLFLTGGETSVVPTCVWDLPSHGRPPQKEPLPNQLVHSVGIVFDSKWDVCGPYRCLGSPITQTSTLVGMSSWPSGSFWLYCFWQAVKCFWSLYMSGFPHHTDLYPIRNVNPKSWFILSVLFLTVNEMSVVPIYVWDPPSNRLPLK